jgi:hypothetical protein
MRGLLPDIEKKDLNDPEYLQDFRDNPSGLIY